MTDRNPGKPGMFAAGLAPRPMSGIAVFPEA